LANKNARIAWSISANKTDFDPKEAVALLKEAA
jgi:hypothetical protein